MTGGKREKQISLIVCVLLACLLLVYGLAGFPGAGELLQYVKNPQLHPALLLLAFFILPLLGVPVSLLLVLLGLRLGSVAGLLSMFLIMPLHLVVSFAVARSFFGEWIKKIAGEERVQRLQVPQHRDMEFSFLFMAVPGLTYTMKNYLLPLSGVRFRYYFLFGWLVQGVTGAPLVILGEAPGNWNSPLVFGAVLIFAVIYGLMKWGQKRYRRLLEPLQKELDENKQR
ncbi:MAG: hypothetical protein R6V54_13925 [Desulfobacteraceae bacterium]